MVLEGGLLIDCFPGQHPVHLLGTAMRGVEQKFCFFQDGIFGGEGKGRYPLANNST